MKRFFVSILLLVASTLCCAQSTSTSSTHDLRKISSEKLTACYDDKSICGTADVYAISDELAKRLPAFSSDQLIDCMKNWKVCGVENDIETGWAVSAELTRRSNLHHWLVHYWTEPDLLVRDGIVHAAYRRRTPEVTEFMKNVLAQGKGDEDALYWSASYLAKQCDTDGLKWLSMRKGRPEGCMIWAPTVALFGKSNYRDAIPYIVENSIQDACLNIDDAGVDDLQHFFPHSPREFETMEKMQTYFCTRAHKKGFKVNCETQ